LAGGTPTNEHHVLVCIGVVDVDDQRRKFAPCSSSLAACRFGFRAPDHVVADHLRPVVADAAQAPGAGAWPGLRRGPDVLAFSSP
jgi:rhamnose utilization protein RhaD (predicted bifunctional aldolase and dehydrogenase)